MSSRRLPGKVLSPILGKPMIVRQLERICRSRAERVVVATSEDETDDAVADIVEQAGHTCYRGSLADVLDRMYRAALSSDAGHVVRLTADCPVIDHRVIDTVIDAHLRDRNDYTSNTLTRSYPDGEDVEVLTMDALHRAWQGAERREDREHVTPFIYTHPELFKLGSVEARDNLAHLRWTVDYPEDLAVVRTIFERLYETSPEFSLEDILELFDRSPELEAMNAAVNPYRKRDPALLDAGRP